MSQTDPRAVAVEIVLKINSQRNRIAGGYDVPADEPGPVSLIAHALADAERREADRCAKDVCMYCGGRALGYSHVIGPNQAGNYIHATPKATGEDVLCRASGIYSRLRAQVQADKEG